MVGVSTSNTPRSAKKRRISAIIAARFNKLAIGALGCQLAVSLMVVNSEIKQGMQSTRIYSLRQICHSPRQFLTRIQYFTL
jgi:putative component of toxin-antitoxin plasmid stabilization module